MWPAALWGMMEVARSNRKVGQHCSKGRGGHRGSTGEGGGKRKEEKGNGKGEGKGHTSTSFSPLRALDISKPKRR